MRNLFLTGAAVFCMALVGSLGTGVLSQPIEAKLELDTADIIWVSSEPYNVNASLFAVDMLSVVRFYPSQTFLDGFSGVEARVIPDTCESHFDCPSARPAADHTTGRYTLDTSDTSFKIFPTETTRSEFVFAPETRDPEVLANTFFQGSQEVTFSIKNNILSRQTPDKIVQYYPFSQQGLDEVLGLLSLRFVAPRDYAECVVVGLHQLSLTAPSDRSADEEQLAALAALATYYRDDALRLHQITENSTLHYQRMSNEAKFERRAVILQTFALDIFQEVASRIAPNQLTPLTDDQIVLLEAEFENVITSASRMAEAFDPLYEADFRGTLSERARTIHIAMPLLNMLENGDRDFYETVCPSG